MLQGLTKYFSCAIIIVDEYVRGFWEGEMKRNCLERQAECYFLPLFLGNTAEARRLATAVYKKFRIRSFILDEKSSWRGLFCTSYHFVPLTRTDSTRLLCEQLTDLSRQYPSALPILVPTEDYKEAIGQHIDTLQTYFVIKEPSALLDSSPLVNIK